VTACSVVQTVARVTTCGQVEAQFEKTTTEEVEVAEESTLSSCSFIYYTCVFLEHHETLSVCYPY